MGCQVSIHSAWTGRYLARAAGSAFEAIATMDIAAAVRATTIAAQRAALVELYLSTNGSSWTDRAGWQNHGSGSDPCDDSWSGVLCSVVGPSRDVYGCLQRASAVTCSCVHRLHSLRSNSLDLSGRGLVGELPSPISLLSLTRVCCSRRLCAYCASVGFADMWI